MRKAFTLVELSIVLIIIGLLVGGILAGKHLIRSAQVRSLSTDHQQFVTAMHTFKDKYFYVPGDLPNAFDFWGTEAGCTDVNVSSDSAGCNGDADGKIDHPGGGEALRAWQHLALADLIPGTYTGAADGTQIISAGVNVPEGRVKGSIFTFTDLTGTSIYGNSGQAIGLGGEPAPTFTWPIASLLNPSEAWGMDKKLDDGNADQGLFLTINAPSGSNCISDPYTNATGSYILNSNDRHCRMWLLWDKK